MSGTVFVSYSRQDQEYVDRLVDYLRASGLAVWVDRELGSADRWLTVIREQIDACAAVVVVMTPVAEKSEMVETELLRARDQGKEIFPLLLDGSPFWHLNNRQYESVLGARLPGIEWVNQVTAAVSEAGTPARPPSRPDRRGERAPGGSPS